MAGKVDESAFRGIPPIKKKSVAPPATSTAQTVLMTPVARIETMLSRAAARELPI